MRRRSHTFRILRGRRRPDEGGQRGQSAVEYMLAISFLAVIVYAAFYVGFNGFGQDSVPGQAFEGYRRTIEAPYP